MTCEASPQLAGLTCADLCLQVLKLNGNSPQLQLPFAALTQLSQLQELYVDRGIRQQMIHTPEAAPLLHWLRF